MLECPQQLEEKEERTGKVSLFHRIKTGGVGASVNEARLEPLQLQPHATAIPLLPPCRRRRRSMLRDAAEELLPIPVYFEVWCQEFLLPVAFRSTIECQPLAPPLH